MRFVSYSSEEQIKTKRLKSNASVQEYDRNVLDLDKVDEHPVEVILESVGFTMDRGGMDRSVAKFVENEERAMREAADMFARCADNPMTLPKKFTSTVLVYFSKCSSDLIRYSQVMNDEVFSMSKNGLTYEINRNLPCKPSTQGKRKRRGEFKNCADVTCEEVTRDRSKGGISMKLFPLNVQASGVIDLAYLVDLCVTVYEFFFFIRIMAAVEEVKTHPEYEPTDLSGYKAKLDDTIRVVMTKSSSRITRSLDLEDMKSRLKGFIDTTEGSFSALKPVVSVVMVVKDSDVESFSEGRETLLQIVDRKVKSAETDFREYITAKYRHNCVGYCNATVKVYSKKTNRESGVIDNSRSVNIDGKGSMVSVYIASCVFHRLMFGDDVVHSQLTSG